MSTITSADDIVTLGRVIKQFWPDFEINSTDLSNPICDLVSRFYSKLTTEYDEEINKLLTELGVPTDIETKFDNRESFPDTLINTKLDLQLFRKSSRIFSKLNLTKLLLSDMFEPQPMRTRFFFKYGIHLLIYLTSSDREKLLEVLGVPFKRAQEIQDIRNLKQQKLEMIRDISHQLCEVDDEIETCSSQIQNLSKPYADMLKCKTAMLQLHEADYKAIADLKAIVELSKNMRLIEENRALQEYIISEDEYQLLMNQVHSVKMEFEQLCSKCEDYSLLLKKQKETIDFLSQCKVFLSNLDFDINSLIVERAASRERIRILKSEIQTVKERADTIQEKVNKKKIGKVYLEDKLLKMNAQNEAMQIQMAEKRESLNKQYENECVAYKHNICIRKTLKETIYQLNVNLKSVEEAEKSLEKFCLAEYRRLKDLCDETWESFHSSVIEPYEGMKDLFHPYEE